MRVLVQRSGEASVLINDECRRSIDSGLVLLVGFTEGDDINKVKYLARKVLNLRIFPDSDGVMNKSILDYGGSILSISQFTLYADTSRGNRPSYKDALSGDLASFLYEEFNKELSKDISVVCGEFGSDMVVNISNIGPTTIMLER